MGSFPLFLLWGPLLVTHHLKTAREHTLLIAGHTGGGWEHMGFIHWLPRVQLGSTDLLKIG